MKQIMTLVMVVTFGALFGQTTLEEYNYVTKGYHIQIESGLDMKKGYKLIDLYESKINRGAINISIKFKGLYRENQVAPCAIMLIYHEDQFLENLYICVPHWDSSKEIWDMYGKGIEDFPETMAKHLVWGFAKAMSFFAKNN